MRIAVQHYRRSLRAVLYGFSVAALLAAVTVAPTDEQAVARISVVANGSFTCDAAIDNPHYSPRAGSVLFKTRITCYGNTPPVQLRLRGTLGSIGGGSPGHPAQGPPITRATSDQTQTIAMGTTAIYYTPLVDGPKVQFAATFEGRIFGQVVGPPGTTAAPPNRGASNRVYISP